jgi:hypothetical protein
MGTHADDISSSVLLTFLHFEFLGVQQTVCSYVLEYMSGVSGAQEHCVWDIRSLCSFDQCIGTSG